MTTSLSQSMKKKLIENSVLNLFMLYTADLSDRHMAISVMMQLSDLVWGK